MKVGFVVNIHISAMRPQDCLQEYLESLKKCIKHDFHVYIIDNGSDTEYEFVDDTLKNKITYTYINDQWNSGVTGAWNIGTKMAIEDNCKIIIGYADDLIWNNSINHFISYIKENYNDDTVYGPVSNQGGNNQTFPEYQSWIKPTGQLHGFLWGFTDQLYHKVKQPNGDFLDMNTAGLDGKWGGQEIILESYKARYGINFIIYGPAWIYHKKFTAWKEAREYEKGTEHHVQLYKGKIK